MKSADQDVGDLLGLLELRRLAEAGPLVGDLALAELEEGDALATRDVRHRLDIAAAQQLAEALALLDHVEGVGAGHPAVTGEQQHRGPLDLFLAGQQGMVDVGPGRHGRERAGDRRRRTARDAVTFARARAIREVAISSIALKIFFIDWVDLIRLR